MSVTKDDVNAFERELRGNNGFSEKAKRLEDDQYRSDTNDALHSLDGKSTPLGEEHLRSKIHSSELDANQHHGELLMRNLTRCPCGWVGGFKNMTKLNPPPGLKVNRYGNGIGSSSRSIPGGMELAGQWIRDMVWMILKESATDRDLEVYCDDIGLTLKTSHYIHRAKSHAQYILDNIEKYSDVTLEKIQSIVSESPIVENGIQSVTKR